MIGPAAALVGLVTAFAGTFPDQPVIGHARTVPIAEGDSLIELARRYDLGFGELAAANPGLNPFVLPAGTPVVVPTAWIVPDLRDGEVLVNLPEMRLYLRVGRGPEATLATFPIGIGVEGRGTPLGLFSVVKKELRPAWHVPDSVRREEPWLPPVVPPGPDNPLGTHALRLSRGHILIHGTNRPFGVGRRVSHGCIRLYPEDIPVLYDLVPVGARVRVVREPVKVGLHLGRILLEVHPDLDGETDLLGLSRALLSLRGLLDRVDPAKLDAAVRERSGVPVDVGR